MATREELLRDLILSPRGQLTIPSANADRETRKAIRELTEGDSPHADYAAGMLDLTAHPDDERLDATTMHNTLAVARNILLHVTTPTREDAIAAHFASSGFTPKMVRDGVNFLRRDRLATRRDGVVTVTVPAPAKRPALPADMVAPRSGGTTPSPAPSTTAAAARPRMDVGRLIEHPDPMAMAARMREQAMPSASFEVGDISSATKTPEKKTTVVIPDSAILTYKTAVLDRWAALGTPTATWAELGVKRPALGDLPEGWTPEKVLQHVIGSMRKQGELAVDEDAKTFTYVPAERAVKAVSDWLGRAALPGKLITPTAAARREDVLKVVPSGWNAETIATLALDAVMEKVDGGWMKTAPEVVETPKAPEPIEPAPEVVETPKPASAPAPAGDTTSPTPKTAPEGTVQMAPTEGKVAQKVEGKKSPDPVTPKTAETPAAPVNAPALEQKVDTLTTKVDGIAARLGTLPPPPSKTATIIAAAREADIDVVVCLEDVLVALYVHDEAPRSVIRDRLPGRVRSKSTGRIRDRRSKLGAALALGTRAGVIAIDDDGKKYRYITHADVLDKHAWKARLDRRLGTAA